LRVQIAVDHCQILFTQAVINRLLPEISNICQRRQRNIRRLKGQSGIVTKNV